MIILVARKILLKLLGKAKEDRVLWLASWQLSLIKNFNLIKLRVLLNLTKIYLNLKTRSPVYKIVLS